MQVMQYWPPAESAHLQVRKVTGAYSEMVTRSFKAGNSLLSHTGTTGVPALHQKACWSSIDCLECMQVPKHVDNTSLLLEDDRTACEALSLASLGMPLCR
jgi:hypothetical protein